MISYFTRFVELKTKIISVALFIMTILYMLLDYQQVDVLNTGLFFISMFFFDMTVTAMNTHFGIKYETVDTPDNSQMQQKMRENSKGVVNIIIITILLLISIVTGIILLFNTNFSILLPSMIAMAIGVFYSYGPIPICRTFLGEILSMFAMGILLPVILLMANDITMYSFSNFTLMFDLAIIIPFLLYIIIPTITIGQVMFANNLEDVKQDILNKRLTLVYYLGIKKSRNLLIYSYFIIFIYVLVLILLNVLSIYYLLVLLCIFSILKDYNELKTKSRFKKIAVKNFVLINLTYAISSIITILFR